MTDATTVTAEPAIPVAVTQAATEVADVANAVATSTATPAPVATAAQVVASGATDIASGGGISDLVAGGIRTIVPFAVGGVIGWVATLGFAFPAALQDASVAGATFLVGSAYYLIVKKIEARWPKAGWLLGVAKAPTYQ